MEQVKLLMTELSPELTRLCAETLAAQDIAVTVCEKDGAKALAALSAEKPDAVLLDAFMPGLDALTVKQRYDEAGGGKTVFFVTGSFTDDALESEMMKKGFSFYFQKPFDPEVLAARARTAAGRHAAAQPVPFPVSWTVKMKKKQKETQDILSYHTQAAGCSDKARAKASGGRQPIEECGRTGL